MEWNCSKLCEFERLNLPNCESNMGGTKVGTGNGLFHNLTGALSGSFLSPGLPIMREHQSQEPWESRGAQDHHSAEKPQTCRKPNQTIRSAKRPYRLLQGPGARAASLAD